MGLPHGEDALRHKRLLRASEALGAVVDGQQLPYQKEYRDMPFKGLRLILRCENPRFTLLPCYYHPQSKPPFSYPSRFRDDLRETLNQNHREIDLFPWDISQDEDDEPLVVLAYTGRPPVLGQAFVGIPDPFLKRWDSFALLAPTVAPDENISNKLPMGNRIPMQGDVPTS